MPDREPDPAADLGERPADAGDTTAISVVDATGGGILIRGYPLVQLAERCRMEQVAWLLLRGELPDAGELAAFEAEARALRPLPDDVRAVVDAVPVDADPMDVLRLAVDVLGGVADPQPAREALLRQALRLVAVLPAVVSYDQRRRRGQALVPPRDDLDHCRNLLWMTLGEEPSDVEADVLRVAMILHAEQVDAARAAARSVAAATADLHTAVHGAVGVLRDSRRGRGTDEVLRLFHEVAVPDEIDERLDAALATDEPIAGFGSAPDDRVVPMRAALAWLVAAREAHGLAELSLRLETAMRERTGLTPDLDFATGPALGLLGFDAWTFPPLLVAARVAGWTAHAMERLGRGAAPGAAVRYTGPAARQVPGRPIGVFSTV